MLQQDAARAKAAGLSDLAESIDQQVTRMERQVAYHLAHARAAASGGAHSAPVALSESVDGLLRTLGRVHADRALSLTSTKICLNSLMLSTMTICTVTRSREILAS